MRSTKYCVKRLQNDIQEKGGEGRKRSLEDLKETLASVTDSCLVAYEKSDWDRMSEVLNIQQELRRELTIELKSASEVYVVSSKIVQTYNIFNKILQLETEKKNIEYKVRFIEQKYKYARKILVYLYKKEYVQHKQMNEILKIPKSSLTDTLQILEEMRIVAKVKIGKYSFYNLTSEGREYIKRHSENYEDKREVYRKRNQNSKDSFSRSINRNRKYREMELLSNKEEKSYRRKYDINDVWENEKSIRSTGVLQGVY